MNSSLDSAKKLHIALEWSGILKMETSGESMSPFFKEKTILLIKRKTSEVTLDTGDIILFFSMKKNRVIAHRVRKKIKNTHYNKG